MWPGVSDYQEAVQTPPTCFDHPELKQGSPVLTKLGLPRPISGGNASVYQIRSGKTEFAVRCFLRNIPDLQQRYAAIDQHLRSAKLSSKVGFEYLTQGIRIRGNWYPILMMEWVRGEPLNDYVGGIRNDPKALRKLAADWQALMKDLERVKIAHGDLQHGNILIAKDKFVLIDYDGMWVPSLAGSPGLELGHPSFQHPGRHGGDFGPDVDRFSALVIQTALLALAEKPQLWDTYDNSDNLLFTRPDFENPEGSALFAELLQLGDKDVVARVRALYASARGPIAAVPRLEEAVAFGRKVDPATVKATAPVEEAPPPPAAKQKQGKGGKQGKQPKAPPAKPAAQPKSQPTSQPKSPPKSQPKPAAPTPVASNAAAPQWLASLMSTPATVPAAGPQASQSGGQSGGRSAGKAVQPASPVGGAAPGRGSAVLQPTWKHRVRGTTRRVPLAKPAGRGATQRAVFLLVLFLALQLGAVLVNPRLLLLTMTVPLGLRWWVRSLRQPAGARGGRAASVGAAAFSVDGTRIAVVGDDVGDVIAAATGKREHSLQPGSQTLVGVVGAGGNRFLTVTEEGTLQLHDAQGGVSRSWHHGRCCSAAATDDGDLIAAGTHNRLVKVFSNDGQERATLRGHRDSVTAITFSRDKQRLVSGSTDHSVRVWSVNNRSCEHVLREHRSPVASVALSADGRFVAAGATDGRVLVWDARTAQLLHDVTTGSPVHSMVFLGRSATVLAGLGDGSIQSVDVGSGQSLGKQPGHQAAVTGLAATPDGSRIVSADAQGTVLSWSAQPATVSAASRSKPAGQLQLARP